MACEVGQFLGGGGQGEVYRARLGGKPVALKWYFLQTATPEQRVALEILVKKGPPNDKFLWPIDTASAPAVSGFGYVMPLRETRYKSLFDLMKGRIDPSFGALVTAGVQLADSFLQLHAKGLCYRDISFGNVFFDPNTGDVLICDNDNVTIDGSSPGGVLGTPDFMAPEIVRGEGRPNSHTDLFSLAVLLFYMFHVQHPLFGKRLLNIRCLDLPARTKLCGLEPIFIFDPNDRSNEAVSRSVDPMGEAGANALKYWKIYPQFVRNLFTKAFTDGIRDAQNGRVRESEWRAAMVRLRDSILYCPHCGAENFYDADSLNAPGAKPAPCWSCMKEIILPYRIRIGRNVVMLNHDSKLFLHHVDDQKMYDFSKPVAEVTRHPAKPSIWGLKNVSTEKWVGVATDGSVKDVEPGRAVPLVIGLKINFGRAEGEIRR
jgi:serine/threonine protein kinase